MKFKDFYYFMCNIELPLTLVFCFCAFPAPFGRQRLSILAFCSLIVYLLRSIRVTVIVFRGKLTFVWVDLLRVPFLLYFLINFLLKTAALVRLSEPEILN